MDSFPVTILVKRPDGSSESVRVGTATRTGDGFQLSLGELSIGAAADPVFARPRVAAPAAGDGPVFPPYGRSKGLPVAGASVQDLEYYISGSRRSLDDPSKARWHDKERVLLAAMEAELAQRTGGGGGAASAGFGGGGFGGGGFGGGGSAAKPPQNDFGDAPPYSDDDDIPF